MPGELRCYMNLLSLAGDKRPFIQQAQAIRKAGYDGVQFSEWAREPDLQTCRDLGFGIAGSARVNEPGQADLAAERLSADGYECGTLHVGWGLEDDDESSRLIEGVLQASIRWRVPLYIETHRATICQDMWRTVQFVSRFPEIRFNGDFSHWYAGQEMVYGGFDRKLKFIQPVLDRVRFLHGRIASPGCIQVPYVPGASYVEHFEQLWTASFRGFLREAPAGKTICFTPELLGPDIFYARTFGGVEESDRFDQASLLTEVAKRCFAIAKQS